MARRTVPTTSKRPSLARDRRREGGPGPGHSPAAGGKDLIRALVHRGSRSDRSPAVAHKAPTAPDPTVCVRCRAVFTRKTWRRSARRLRDAMRRDAPGGVCPACAQAARGPVLGRLLVTGAYVEGHADEIRRRVANVAARAAFTQPERRVLAVVRHDGSLEILTTSQKLAHRLARELQKAFRGAVSYAWSDRDGELLAVWRREE